MRKKSVITNFSRETLDGLLHLSGEIINKMTENASSFPNLPVPLAQVTKERDEYQKVFDSSEHSGRTGALQKARTVLQESLQANGKYVNDLANGDLEILEKSGYPLAKGHTPVGDLPEPNFLKVEATETSRVFHVKVDRLEDAWGYLVACAKASDAVEEPKDYPCVRYVSKHEAMIEVSFARGVELKFAACGVASSETLHWVKASKTLFVH